MFFEVNQIYDFQLLIFHIIIMNKESGNIVRCRWALWCLIHWSCTKQQRNLDHQFPLEVKNFDTKDIQQVLLKIKKSTTLTSSKLCEDHVEQVTYQLLMYSILVTATSILVTPTSYEITIIITLVSNPTIISQRMVVINKGSSVGEEIRMHFWIISTYVYSLNAEKTKYL